MRAISDPSNSVPYSDFKVIGLSVLHIIFSHMLTAMKRETPDPNPYPFCSISSSRITINPDAVS